MLGSLGLGKDLEPKPDEKKKRGRKPGSRKSTEVVGSEPKKAMLP
jgi:hypothetical protein